MVFEFARELTLSKESDEMYTISELSAVGLSWPGSAPMPAWAFWNMRWSLSIEDRLYECAVVGCWCVIEKSACCVQGLQVKARNTRAPVT